MISCALTYNCTGNHMPGTSIDSEENPCLPTVPLLGNRRFSCRGFTPCISISVEGFTLWIEGGKREGVKGRGEWMGRELLGSFFPLSHKALLLSSEWCPATPIALHWNFHPWITALMTWAAWEWQRYQWKDSPCACSWGPYKAHHHGVLRSNPHQAL